MECSVCTEEFLPKKATAKYCSESCKNRAKYLRRKAQNTVTCGSCENTVAPGRSYCSRKCYHRSRTRLTADGRKSCGKCLETKDVTEFNVKDPRRGTQQSYCRVCDNDANKKWYYKNRERTLERNRRNKTSSRNALREKVNQIKVDSGCVDCGYNHNPIALDFDHISGAKRANVSTLVSQAVSWKAIEEEIAKCVVRCSNCHRIVTKQRLYKTGP